MALYASSIVNCLVNYSLNEAPLLSHSLFPCLAHSGVASPDININNSKNTFSAVWAALNLLSGPI